MSGRPPRVALTEKPEFKAAVAETAAMVVQSMMRAGVVPGPAGGSPAAADGSPVDEKTTALFREMAMSMAEIADQGTTRKKIAPEILAKRAAAFDRLVVLLQEVHGKLDVARRDGDHPTIAAWTPEWRVIAKVYLNERMIEPFKTNPDKSVVPNEIYWTGMPSDALTPMNDIARRIFAEYRQWSGGIAGTPRDDKRPFWVTSNGLVVKGDPPNRRFVAAPQDFKDDLEVKGPHDPTAPFVNVLGSIAAPARQSAVQGGR